MWDPNEKDERRIAIIGAAFEAISTYGFRRTSMEDIAKAAGISRPALYQTFANKSDIFRAGVLSMQAAVAAESEALIASNAPALDVVEGLIDVNVVAPYQLMCATPHGHELLGLKHELAPDLFQDWNNNFKRFLTQAFTERHALDATLAQDTASMLANALEALKARQLPLDEFMKEVAGLLRVVGALI